jgi:hypothetical protein
MGGYGSGATQKVNRERVIALLQEKCISMSEIAYRVGCSRERIRQLALKYLGITGRERNWSCPLNRSNRVPELPDHNFVHDCLDLGFDVQPILNDRGSSNKQMVLVNGKSCLLRKASTRFAGIHSSCTVVFHISRSGSGDYDVCVYELDDGRWLIVPQDRIPFRSTDFSVFPRARVAAYSKRHDWITYINAWQFLGGDMKILEPVAKESLVGGSEKWKAVLEKLTTVPDGMALPVQFDKNQDAAGLQAYIFGYQNRKGYDGPRYECRRIKATLYISKAVNGTASQQ